jgi:hypothetical protein
LEAAGTDDERLEELDALIAEKLDAAIARARAAAEPDFAFALADVYTRQSA